MKENIKIVTAGAGSGKTYRLATEVLRAIQQQEARPEGILLTTFTRKAAAELEERVRVRLLEQGAWEEFKNMPSKPGRARRLRYSAQAKI